ncbi:uncharacterized protein LOC34622762 [Cyclospora cayetanensis]|uniref:Uncharacterized protein LOC34622762 n=1 Tax=Cyclospora cayetanensis TaxID=88456 RepID=A0A6P6RSZ5_9EIME|nr:uncharacterized protein LOC34622762 [Cyclospora cayetanensis]
MPESLRLATGKTFLQWSLSDGDPAEVLDSLYVGAFFGQEASNGIPGGRKSVACNSALESFSSFFGRRKVSPGSSNEQQPTPQQNQKHARIDLYRLMGIAPESSGSAIAVRAKELQQRLRQLSSGDSVPPDPLLSSLLRDTVTVLQDAQQRAAYSRDNVLPASLSALLDQLPDSSVAHTRSNDEKKQNTSESKATSDDATAEAVPRRPLELFSELFGDGLLGGSSLLTRAKARRIEQTPKQGSDVEAQVTLGFVAAALEGAPSIPITVNRLEACEACTGTGGTGRRKPAPCKACDGRGMKTEGFFPQTRRSSYGVVSTSISCPACGGIGHHPPPRCGNCGGHGRQPCKTTLQVGIPAGVADGALLRVEGQGSAGENGGPRGDLYITVRVEQHSHFTRKGADVHSEESIGIADAALGSKIMVKTIDGEAELTIPPNWQPSQKLILKGRGAKVPGNPHGIRGDHVVTLRVSLPEKITPEESQLLKQLREARKKPGT